MPDMSNTKQFAEPLLEAIEVVEVPERRLDDMVGRILRQMERHGLFEAEDPNGEVDGSDYHSLAESVAARGTVLLENDGLLPLEDDLDVAVLGPSVTQTTSRRQFLGDGCPSRGVDGRRDPRTRKRDRRCRAGCRGDPIAVVLRGR